MTDQERDQHEKDRDFLAWAQDPGTLSADLRAKWAELDAIDDPTNLWKFEAIKRELQRRGEVEPI